MDILSYIIGLLKGRASAESAEVEISGDISAADDGQGNITITEVEVNG